MLDLSFSAFFNGEVVSELNRSQSTLRVFFEVISQAAMMIVTIFIILHFLPKLPSLVKNAPNEHMQFRLRGADILLAFAIVACELKFLDKLRYLYNEERDAEAAIAFRKYSLKLGKLYKSRSSGTRRRICMLIIT